MPARLPVKYHVIISTIIISVLLAQVPIDYKLSIDNTLYRYENITKDGLNSNSIVDIRPIDKSYILLSTANGLSYANIYNSQLDSVSFGYFDSDSLSLPRGGIPALAVKENIVVLSGIMDTTAVTGEELMGTGIAYSIDEGENWIYLPQPIDDIPQTGKYQTLLWGEQEISALAVTTEINNISYDLAIGGDYIYAASWAGGLRRYGPLLSNLKSWEIIPLPMDSDTSLICGQIDLGVYELNPNDPDNGGNHNHKEFSVHVMSDTIIWAGTANGINKGIIDTDCINWIHHYTSSWDNISGNWIIGFTNQILDNGFNRFWAITWATESHESHALSYTDDSGENWHVTSPSGYSEKVYNLYVNESRIWAASESGLYVSEDGQHWEKYSRPIDSNSGEKLLTQPVLSVYSDANMWLWMGTADGIAISNDDGEKWTIQRFWTPTDYKNTDNMLSVYPNPFLIDEYNQVGMDGHVRFIYSNIENYNSMINIYDFTMDKVVQLDDFHMVNNIESELIWNGRNEYGEQVANGVYFCRLSLNGKYYWTKLAIVNSK